MLVEVLLFAVLVFLLWKTFRKPPGLPPGRWGLPLVGYIPWTSKNFEEQVIDLHQQYGDIFLWRMGTQLMVFLNNYKLMKEACSRSEFTVRPDWDIMKFLEETPKGIASSNGVLWHNNRRFTLRQLRDLGMGKSSLVEAVQHQCLKLRETLAEGAGTPAMIPHQLHVTVLNVIWHMVASKQFDAEDKRLQEFVKLMSESTLLSNRMAIKDFMPWLQNIIPDFLFKRLIKYYELMDLKEKFLRYFAEEIKEHKATLDPDNPRDLIDSYLLEMEAKKDDPDTTCSEQDLMFLMLDMFFAGSETTVNTFTWLCCYLAAHPQVQRKLQAEIDEVLPGGALPTLAEKPKMPYTEAVINEVMRACALVNFGLQHMAANNTQLGGYTIPKGAVVSANVTSIHYDSRFWDRPREFRPERWLDENGKFFMPKDGFLPFGVGKRVCVGESMARMEMFILTAMVFQCFTIAPPPGKSVNLTPDLSGLFFRKAMPNEFVFTVREQ
ncbi:cytochrome P450 2L1-like isoform X2 [Portunus trituberculatus]|uniref:cytochrome P450 2L1-like isoform X2 n=1 Tax=Portunus trituberculatus TaxID=210409 RepID=UPI001E1CDB97|nr:cytochrome P450 2L1-like isoform X2 [Portunus trituberculatus]